MSDKHQHEMTKFQEDALWQKSDSIRWTQLLLDSYQYWLGKELIERHGSPIEQAARLFRCPCIVVSHGLQGDPILNYGNHEALGLWEMDWNEFTSTPSRRTAEPVNQAERAEMLRVAELQGYIDDYRGVRISKTGKRFWVEEAIVWNVIDAHRVKHGQAATFSKWSYVDTDCVS